ncbi:MAG: pacearchaeosortase, partial [Candidatus Woesearchaeota archaeon]
MEEETKNILNLVLRYVILVLVAVPNLYLFYKLFTPITIQAVYYSLKIFFDVSISGNAISFNPSCLSIEIIEACIAGSAYYLLLLFNLSTPNIEFKKRIWLILAAFSSFFVLNIVRIFVLSVLLLNRSSFFDFSHRLSWYV